MFYPYPYQRGGRIRMLDFLMKPINNANYEQTKKGAAANLEVPLIKEDKLKLR